MTAIPRDVQMVCVYCGILDTNAFIGCCKDNTGGHNFQPVTYVEEEPNPFDNLFGSKKDEKGER